MCDLSLTCAQPCFSCGKTCVTFPDSEKQGSGSSQGLLGESVLSPLVRLLSTPWPWRRDHHGGGDGLHHGRREGVVQVLEHVKWCPSDVGDDRFLAPPSHRVERNVLLAAPALSRPWGLDLLFGFSCLAFLSLLSVLCSKGLWSLVLFCEATRAKRAIQRATASASSTRGRRWTSSAGWARTWARRSSTLLSQPACQHLPGSYHH